MFSPGEIITYLEMCGAENASLQAGMNFKLAADHSVVLMSRRPKAPYRDQVIEDGTVILYEGHDAKKGTGQPDPKTVDQPMRHPSGGLTQNGLFFEAATRGDGELVRVYEKLRPGVWVFNGTFLLADATQERSGERLVFRFRLEVANEDVAAGGANETPAGTQERSRVIPSAVKNEVFVRDRGQCVLCGANDEIHFDHELPFSRGGSSTVENIRILCARHNLTKGARIE